MKIIAGAETADAGSVNIQKGLRIGYLAQQGELTGQETVREVLEHVFDPLVRMEEEMRALEKFLSGAAASLKPDGRLAVITYHSLEDRMVKNFIRSGNVGGDESKDSFGWSDAPLQAVNRKPVLPDESEIAFNTRARSAKLRIAEKL